MTKQTHKPAPKPVIQPNGPVKESGIDNGEGENVVSLADLKAKGVRKSFINERTHAISQMAAEKHAIMGDVRQKLAEAADAYKQGLDVNGEAQAIADNAAGRLYKGRTAGVISADELSAILGDVFGYKLKTDGKPGKTPDGQGEAIRKRIVRAVQAFEHVNGRDGGAFFADLPKDASDEDGQTIQDVLDRISEGETSLFTAYDRFAAIKKASQEARIPMAFDPKKIAAITESLSNVTTAAQHLIDNPALADAYAAMLAVFGTVDGVAADMLAETKAA